MLRRLLLLFVLAAPVGALAQPLAVLDAFSDGDFTANPTWTSPDASRWMVALRSGNPALSSNGPAASDTLSISTPSAVSVGTWRFRFAWTTDLTNANGARIFLTSDRDDLTGPVRGYAIQFGTTNTDDVRLIRIDGDHAVRTTVGNSMAGLVAGAAGERLVEVTRTGEGVWTVVVDGVTAFSATDARYLTSSAFGVWVKHSSATGRAYAFDDVDVQGSAGPPDTTAPRVTAFDLNADQTLATVTLSELVPAASLGAASVSITPSVAFTRIAPPVDPYAGLDLAFNTSLPTGAYALRLSGIADAAGNMMRDTTLTFTVERDETPPVLTSVTVVSPRLLDVQFSEPFVNGCDASRYSLTGAGGLSLPVTGVSCLTIEPLSSVQLTLGADVPDGAVVTLTATGIRDAAGNTGTSTLTFTRPAVAQRGDVVVNEIQFAPPTGGTEWVELYNRSTRTIDLADLRLSDNSAAPRPITARSTPLAPGAYAVVGQDSAAFAAAFPGTPGLVVRMSPWATLNNDADAVVLRRADGALVDSVAYSASWGRTGVTLERRDPDGPAVRANFGATTDTRGGTPGARNSVFFVDTAAPVALRAERTTVDGATLVRVSFDEPVDPASLAGAFSTDAGAPTSVTAEGDGTSVLLAGIGGATRVTVTGVRDAKGNAAAAQTVVVAGTPAAGSLAVTEVMLAPRTSGTAPQVEYIEIPNTSSVAVSLRTLRLVARPIVAAGDDPVAADTVRFDDADRTLPAGGRLVLYDSDASDGDPATASRLSRAFPSIDLRDGTIVLVGRSTVTSGGLSNTGECLTLLAGTAVLAPETCVRGAWSEPTRATGASLERLAPTSTGPRGWASSVAPEGGTPGRPNSAAPIADASGDASLLRISEILYQPLADSRDARPDQTDFVEVVNTGTGALDLNGLVLLTSPDELGRRDSLRLAYTPTRLGPGDVAVFFRPSTAVPDASAFRAAYPAMPAGGVLLPVTGLTLTDSGDEFTLRQIGDAGTNGADLERVRYAPDFHSGALRTATGVSLERLDLGRPALDASNWASSPSIDGATPGSPNAVTANAAGTPERAGVAASPSPFSPDGDGVDDAVTVAYRLRGTATSVRVRIYDANGRLVRTLPPAPAGTTGVVAWDGADDQGRDLPMGIYVILLDALDDVNARGETHRGVVTLARRL